MSPIPLSGATATALVLAAALGSGSPVSAQDADQQLREQLRSLGYVDHAEERADSETLSGVIRNEAEASAGYNLYNSPDRPLALLLDMDGTEIHRWSLPLGGSWHHVELLPDGHLLVLSNKAGYVALLTWDSSLVWKHAVEAHHDVAVGPSGEFYLLGRERVPVEFDGRSMPVVNDFIAVYTREGVLSRKVDLLPVFSGRLKGDYLQRLSDLHKRWAETGDSSGLAFASDPFHVNSIERIPRDVPGLAQEGDFLLCARNLDMVAVFDLDERRVKWTWGPGELEAPHQPALTDDGHILVFDNGTRRESSRVLEVDPASGSIVWEYPGTAGSFYSRTRGGNQKLPNGNVLITESNRGRVFEVTPDGRTVWDFYNPLRLENDRSSRAAIYRMTRLPRAQVTRLLARPEPPLAGGVR